MTMAADTSISRPKSTPNKKVIFIAATCRKQISSMMKRMICSTRRRVSPSISRAGSTTSITHSQSPSAQGQSIVSFCHQFFISPPQDQFSAAEAVGLQALQESHAQQRGAHLRAVDGNSNMGQMEAAHR